MQNILNNFLHSFHMTALNHIANTTLLIILGRSLSAFTSWMVHLSNCCRCPGSTINSFFKVVQQRKPWQKATKLELIKCD